jgi:hypothetical protein
MALMPPRLCWRAGDFMRLPATVTAARPPAVGAGYAASYHVINAHAIVVIAWRCLYAASRIEEFCDEFAAEKREQLPDAAADNITLFRRAAYIVI